MTYNCDNKVMKNKNYKKMSKNTGFIDIFGIHAVRSALNNCKRNHKKLVISQSNSSLISKKTHQKIEKIQILSIKEMNKIYGKENTHQGIVLTSSKLIQPTLDEILIKSSNKKVDVVIMLDQVNDTNNIGSIMRSSVMFNCKSIIVPKNNSPDITSSMAKVASGAIEYINYIKVTNLSQAIEKFKKRDYWVCAFDSNKKKNYTEFEIPKKCLLVFGAEGKGLRNLTKKVCDSILSIPTNKNTSYEMDSLNVSNACSIALFEHFRKYSK